MLKRSMLSLAIAVGVMAGVALQTSTAKALDANEVSYWLDFARLCMTSTRATNTAIRKENMARVRSS